MDEFQDIWRKVIDKATRSRLDRLQNVVCRLAEGGGSHYGSIVGNIMIEYLSKKNLGEEETIRCVYGMSSVLRGGSTKFDRGATRFMRGLASEIERHVDCIAQAFTRIEREADKLRRVLRLWRAEHVLETSVLDILHDSLQENHKEDSAVTTPDSHDSSRRHTFEKRMARMQQSSARVEYMKRLDA